LIHSYLIVYNPFKSKLLTGSAWKEKGDKKNNAGNQKKQASQSAKEITGSDAGCTIKKSRRDKKYPSPYLVSLLKGQSRAFHGPPYLFKVCQKKLPD